MVIRKKGKGDKWMLGITAVVCLNYYSPPQDCPHGAAAKRECPPCGGGGHGQAEPDAAGLAHEQLQVLPD